MTTKLSRSESETLNRRRRGRNVALLIGLIAIAAMFYAIAIVKMANPLGHG